jgi:RNA polymerase sigma-32 factor
MEDSADQIKVKKMTTQALQRSFITIPINSIENYVHSVNAVPMLTAEEETDLSNRWFYQQDTDAARQLVMSHLRFVVKIARGFMGYGLNFSDLIQEGNIGLMKAVKRFDPTIGVRLVSFAIHWIKAEIHAFVIKNWRIVKIATTKAQRKLFFNLRSMKKKLQWFTNDDVQMIAEELKVKPETVREMEMRLVAQDHSFDTPSEGDEEDKHALPIVPSEFLHAEDADPASIMERHQRESILNKIEPALDDLNAREKEIIRTRWMNGDIKVTFKELAEKFGISIERVRQIEEAALLKLRAQLQH